MSVELNLLPCPFCGEPAGDVMGFPGCEPCALVRRDAESWNRRASPAAAVPEGALPPLPKPWRERVPNLEDYPNSRRAAVAMLHAEAEIAEWRARAAVEADRAQRQALSVPPFAAPAGLLNADELAALRRFDECAQDGEGYDVPKEMMQRLAEIGVVRRKSGAYYEHTAFGLAVLATRCRAEGGDGAVTDYGSLVDNSADRAQQGEPVGYVRESSLARLGSTDSTATIWSKPHASDFVPVYRAATKAAAPADAPIVAALKRVRGLFSKGVDPRLDAALDDIDKALSDAAPVPDTGIPTAGEVSIDTPPFRELLDEFAYRASERRAMGGDFGSAEAEEKAEAALISYIDRCRAPISATPTSGEVEKGGWKWVPVEPTDEMREACRVLNYCDDIDAEWARMLAAAPSHPSEAKAGNDA